MADSEITLAILYTIVICLVALEEQSPSLHSKSWILLIHSSSSFLCTWPNQLSLELGVLGQAGSARGIWRAEGAGCTLQSGD